MTLAVAAQCGDLCRVNRHALCEDELMAFSGPNVVLRDLVVVGTNVVMVRASGSSCNRMSFVIVPGVGCCWALDADVEGT